MFPVNMAQILAQAIGLGSNEVGTKVGFQSIINFSLMWVSENRVFVRAQKELTVNFQLI